MAAGKRNGTRRENDIKRLLEADGWLVTRGAASLGAADLVALKAGELPRLIQVKANLDGGPYANFRRGEREELRQAARAAGAVAELAWWPHVKAGALHWYDQSVWPPLT